MLQNINQTVLETQRLLLKELSPEIMNQLFTSFGDQDIMSFMGLKSLKDLEMEKAISRKGLRRTELPLRIFY
jgi:ribosomal-protein-alanine N-acetyltransferase